MVRVNGERLLEDLRTLRKFGSIGTGVVRQALSGVDIDSRHWLVERMREAGLDAGSTGSAPCSAGPGPEARRSWSVPIPIPSPPGGGSTARWA